jgi:hypothetical protein
MEAPTPHLYCCHVPQVYSIAGKRGADVDGSYGNDWFEGAVANPDVVRGCRQPGAHLRPVCGAGCCVYKHCLC